MAIESSNDLTRRDFTKAAVVAAVAPALAACAGTAAPETSPTPTPGVPAPNPTTAATTPAAAPDRQEPTPVARALMDVIRAQYGERMTEAEMAKVQRSISGVLATAERLRRFPLPVSTEPTFFYRVPGGAS